MSKAITIPAISKKEKPVVLRGIMKDFAEGQLCFVVARRYKGKGPVRLLLHKARSDSFGYGAFGCYLVSPATLMGSATSDKKAEASKRNGKRGGRPKNKPRKDASRSSMTVTATVNGKPVQISTKPL